jgi:hypothetical protein
MMASGENRLSTMTMRRMPVLAQGTNSGSSEVVGGLDGNVLPDKFYDWQRRRTHITISGLEVRQMSSYRYTTVPFENWRKQLFFKVIMRVQGNCS